EAKEAKAQSFAQKVTPEPTAYQCFAEQCPRVDLKEIQIDLNGKVPKFITPVAVGEIQANQWTRLGTEFNVNWTDQNQNKTSEKLILNVLDMQHMTLKDELGRINRYKMVEAKKPDTDKNSDVLETQ
ncbi:hypothetical protein, partial [Acinetobacter sp. Ver3]|uniref:hypothetical protein n=1 Tax=Acinetobacter sp. Ver3 TaxID=466088 RepID=UPI0005505454